MYPFDQLGAVFFASLRAVSKAQRPLHKGKVQIQINSGQRNNPSAEMPGFLDGQQFHARISAAFSPFGLTNQARNPWHSPRLSLCSPGEGEVPFCRSPVTLLAAEDSTLLQIPLPGARHETPEGLTSALASRRGVPSRSLCSVLFEVRYKS